MERADLDGVASVVARRVARAAAAAGAVVGWVVPFAFADGDTSQASDSVLGPALLAGAGLSVVFHAAGGFLVGLLLGYLQARIAVAVIRRRRSHGPTAATGAVVVLLTGGALTVGGFLGGTTTAELTRLPISVVITLVGAAELHRLVTDIAARRSADQAVVLSAGE